MVDQVRLQRERQAIYRESRAALDVVLGPLVGRVMSSPTHSADIPPDEAQRIIDARG